MVEHLSGLLQKMMDKTRQLYVDDPRSDSFNCLIYGRMGTGKTRIIKTCRKPVLVHSFDPGGCKTIDDEARDPRSGIVVNPAFEVEDALNPTAYDLWVEEFKMLANSGVFDELGTYVIDSATSWSEALMNAHLKTGGRAGGIPQQRDYLITMSKIRDLLKMFTGLPCDCLLTGHVDSDKDDAHGRMFATVQLTGKLKVKIPLLFDEVYCAMTEETSRGVEHFLLTQPDGIFEARTRLGREGRFDVREKPDIKYLLKKAGYDPSDKPF